MKYVISKMVMICLLFLLLLLVIRKSVYESDIRSTVGWLCGCIPF